MGCEVLYNEKYKSVADMVEKLNKKNKDKTIKYVLDGQHCRIVKVSE